MFKILPDTNGNILILAAEGKLTDEDYKEVLIPRLEAIIKDYGKAKLLLDMGNEFQGWETAALWDDAHFGFKHRNDFEKMGVIGAPKWFEWGLKVASLAISGDIKSFSPDEKEKAYRWIKS